MVGEPRLTAYDIIGDIHGYAAPLESLLRRMGYVPHGTSWRAPQGRKAIFVGDLIDRGPEQVREVETVRSMVDDRQAPCVRSLIHLCRRPRTYACHLLVLAVSSTDNC